MIKYKVLDENLQSPFREMEYEIGKEYICNDFDPDPTSDSINGFYATDIDGIFCSYRPGKKIFECEVVGKQTIYSQFEQTLYNEFKQRFEKIKLIKEIPIEEVKKRLSELKYNWNIAEATFPINPFEIDYKFDKSHIELVRQWKAVRDLTRESVWGFCVDSVLDTVGISAWGFFGEKVSGFVGGSVEGSVGHSVRDSVMKSAGDFVGDSVWAYISSLFPGIKKWRYIDHPKGKIPFQPAIDLWRLGAVITYDGEIFRIHSKNGIEWEGKL